MKPFLFRLSIAAFITSFDSATTFLERNMKMEGMNLSMHSLITWGKNSSWHECVN
jgi:hypothetical protein